MARVSTKQIASIRAAVAGETPRTAKSKEIAFWGPEPEGGKDYSTERTVVQSTTGHTVTLDAEGYQHALNWYSAQMDKEQAVKFMAAYLKSKNIQIDLKRIGFPSYKFPQTYAWIARLLTRGCKVPARSERNLEILIREMRAEDEATAEAGARAKEDNAKPLLTKIFTPKKIYTAKYLQVLDAVDEKLEKLEWTFNFGAMFKTLSKEDRERLARHYSPSLKDVQEYFRDKGSQDDMYLQLCEYYENAGMDEAKLKLYRKTLQAILRAAEEPNAGPLREEATPAQKRKVTKMVSAFKYLPEYEGVKSKEPRDVLEAKEVFVYNTKYNLLQYFRAGENGLGIEKSSWTGVEERSLKQVPWSVVVEFLKAPSKKAYDAIEARLRKGLDDKNHTHNVILAFAR